MKSGDIIEFWDYDGGDGWVLGLVIEICKKKYRHDCDPIKSVKILYKNSILDIPLDDECIRQLTTGSHD